MYNINYYNTHLVTADTRDVYFNILSGCVSGLTVYFRNECYDCLYKI